MTEGISIGRNKSVEKSNRGLPLLLLRIRIKDFYSLLFRSQTTDFYSLLLVMFVESREAGSGSRAAVVRVLAEGHHPRHAIPANKNLSVNLTFLHRLIF
jgi:hypothetical protein